MENEPKKLYRSTQDKWIGGVCGGLGDYTNLDATIIRVIFILFAMAVGGGILLYLILWLVIPLEPDASSEVIDIQSEEETIKTDE